MPDCFFFKSNVPSTSKKSKITHDKSACSSALLLLITNLYFI